MVDIVQIDHVTEGLAQLPSQWEDKPVVRGILEAWLTPLNESEADLIDVRDGFNVNTAVGFSLDIIGGYFNEARNGRNDNDYRDALLSIIASSNGSGTPNDIIDLFSSVAETTEVSYWEHYPLSVAIFAQNGTEVALNGEEYMLKAMPAGVEFAAVMYDTNGWAWIPSDKQEAFANVITNTPDNVISNDGVEDFNVAAQILLEEVNGGATNSSFVDVSIPQPDEVGWGAFYGANFGGSTPVTSIFVEASILGNPETISGGNGYVEWAEDEVEDPETLTTNKAEPIQQLKDSGLKRRQPLARQFFNWMMAKIDDWFFYLGERTTVGSIRMTYDAGAIAADYDTRYGGTWASAGSTIYTMAGGINPTETIYFFERTA